MRVGTFAAPSSAARGSSSGRHAPPAAHGHDVVMRPLIIKSDSTVHERW